MTQSLKLTYLQVRFGAPFFCNGQLSFEYNKIYIGQLPLAIQDNHLRDIFTPLVDIKEIRIIKGDNTRGKFDLFCYAFVTFRGNEAFANEIIRKVQEKNPSWKMNVKHDLERPRNHQNTHPNNRNGYQPSFQPHYTQLQSNFPKHQHLTSTQPSTEKIVGSKNCHIIVRELWLGGIPENLDKMYMGHVMSQFGLIEEIQIFAKFAFVKFKMAHEATIAFERAEQIYQMLGNPVGFRLFFSDPSRRANIVSNNYEFDRQSGFTEILFLGFPPITSANVELEHMRGVCQKYGVITNEYMRKNTNTQNRSYMLLTYDSVKSALRAKQELSKRRDLLGDKRVEVTLLLDEEIITKGKDLTYTQKMFQGEMAVDKRKNNFYDNTFKPPMMGLPINYPPIYPPHMYGSYINPYFNQPFFDPSYQPPKTVQDPSFNENTLKKDTSDNANIHEFLQNVFSEKEASKEKSGNEKKPEKKSERKEESESDLINKLLGKQNLMSTGNEAKSGKEEWHHKDEREPSWSGFLTWKGLKRVGVDGHSTTVEPEDYAINILSLIEFKDIIIKEKNIMVLEPSNSISEPTFKEYVKNLRQKVGVSLNSQYLMYVMSRSPQSDEIERIHDNELLVVLEKATSLNLIRDKLIKCEEI